MRRSSRKAANACSLRIASETPHVRKIMKEILGKKPQRTKNVNNSNDLGSTMATRIKAKSRYIQERDQQKKAAIEPVFVGGSACPLDVGFIEESIEFKIPESMVPFVNTTLHLLTQLSGLESIGRFDLTFLAALHPVLRILSCHSDNSVSVKAYQALTHIRSLFRTQDIASLTFNDLLIGIEILGENSGEIRATALNKWVEELRGIQDFAQVSVYRSDAIQKFINKDGPRYRSLTELIEQWEALCQLQTQIVRISVLSREFDLLTPKATNVVKVLQEEWISKGYQARTEAAIQAVLEQAEGTLREADKFIHIYKAAMMSTHSSSTIPPHFSGRRQLLFPECENGRDMDIFLSLKSHAQRLYKTFSKAVMKSVKKKAQKRERKYASGIRYLDHLLFLTYSLDIITDGTDEEVLELRDKLRTDVLRLTDSKLLYDFDGFQPQDSPEKKAYPWTCGLCLETNTARRKTCSFCRITHAPVHQRIDPEIEKARNVRRQVRKQSRLAYVMNDNLTTYSKHEKEKWSLHLLTAVLFSFLQVIPREKRKEWKLTIDSRKKRFAQREKDKDRRKCLSSSDPSSHVNAQDSSRLSTSTHPRNHHVNSIVRKTGKKRTRIPAKNHIQRKERRIKKTILKECRSSKVLKREKVTTSGEIVM